MHTSIPTLLTPLLLALAEAPPVTLAHPKPVHGVLFSPDGRTLLSVGDDGEIRIWDVAARREVRRWKAHEGGITTLAQTADGRTLATGGRDGAIRLWDVASGKEKWKFEGLRGDVEGLSLSADGRTLAASASGLRGAFRTLRQGRVFT
jgi:WD40 repeat protein